jgi:anti-sigma factor RsiW
MPCAAFEDLLRDYEELTDGERQRADAHLAACGDCREYLETLTDLDRELSALYEGLEPRPWFHQKLTAQIASRAIESRPPRRPSFLPEILDFCGWAAIVAIVAVLAVTAAVRVGLQ